ncbi:hypothetical protein LY39_00071 [Roseinatronobacter bogoriensis subsp. barguzinensis]|nr:hypothetical protein LY39_00071 [Rhodobaca barguzinensis]TDY74848.1 hypothetical protein EV660_101893 [Rhodobaca bogoriensis DSM 18756]
MAREEEGQIVPTCTPREEEWGDVSSPVLGFWPLPECVAVTSREEEGSPSHSGLSGRRRRKARNSYFPYAAS